VSFDTITLCVVSQAVFVVVYFVIDSVRKLLDTPSYTFMTWCLSTSLPIIDINTRMLGMRGVCYQLFMWKHVWLLVAGYLVTTIQFVDLDLWLHRNVANRV